MPQAWCVELASLAGSQRPFGRENDHSRVAERGEALNFNCSRGSAEGFGGSVMA